MSLADYHSLLLSLELALLTSLLLITLCTPLAFWLTHTHRLTRQAVQLGALLTLVLPPTVLGYYLVLAMGPNYWLGSIWAAVFGSPFAFSFAGLVMGSAIYSFPFALQPLLMGFQTMNPHWNEVAATLGLSPSQRAMHIWLPHMLKSISLALALVFAHTMGEFGIVLMIGGSIPQTRTASIALFEHFETFNVAAANELALWLILSALLLLIPLYSFRQKQKAS
ncbi:MAG: molybdate ABC transporter permease subunit [Gammaproteobacteria bacterium]